MRSIIPTIMFIFLGAAGCTTAGGDGYITHSEHDLTSSERVAVDRAMRNYLKVPVSISGLQSSYDLETTNVVAAGECVVVEMRHRATGLNGREYDTEHCLVFAVRGERIQAVREYIDSLYLKQQMMA